MDAKMTTTSPETTFAGHRPDHDLNDVRRQRALILSILCDFFEEDTVDQLAEWCRHVGFDLSALSDNPDLVPAWLGHYRCRRGYDVERALSDLVAWPPIADRIAKLSKHSPDAAQKKGRIQTAEILPINLGNLSNDL